MRILPLLALASCTFVTESDWDTRRDADGDGADAIALGGDDCDDTDPAVHPGADDPEDCGEIDFDCDGSTGTEDADEDGFSACEECDDTDAQRSPAATEVCDDEDLDEDCNGLADDEDPDTDPSTRTTYFPDADDDGHGAKEGLPTVACDDPGPGWAPSQDDCDDANPAVPMPREWCVSGSGDEDCDQSSDGFDSQCKTGFGTGTAELHLTSAETSAFATSMALGRDADGTPVLAVGDWKSDLNAEDSGTVFVYDDLLGDRDADTARATARGYAPADSAGSSLDFGNIDDDPEDELLIGVGGLDAAWGGGAILLVDVPTSGVVLLDPSAVAMVHGASGELDGLGFAGDSAAADVDDDGSNELIIGAPFHGYGKGAVFVFRGPHVGQRSTPDAFFTFKAEGPSALGIANSTAVGDLDGDGVPDLAIGTRVGEANNGEAIIVTGPLSAGVIGPDDATIIARAGVGVNEVGADVDIGDFDGDGSPDLAVQGRWWNTPSGQEAQRVYVIPGMPGTDLTSSAMTTINGPVGPPVTGEGHTPTTRFIGDLDGDGFEDIALGRATAARVMVVWGGTTGTVDATTLYNSPVDRDGFLVKGPVDSHLGYKVAGADGWLYTGSSVIGEVWGFSGGRW